MDSGSPWPTAEVVAMQWLPVRCCCNPMKLRGFLRVSTQQLAPFTRVTVRLLRDIDGIGVLCQEMPGLPTPAMMSEESVTFLVTPFMDMSPTGYVREIALKAEDMPLEILRRVPGFLEAGGRPDAMPRSIAEAPSYFSQVVVPPGHRARHVASGKILGNKATTSLVFPCAPGEAGDWRIEKLEV